jgi:thiopurine S-methyltransferase
MDAEFWHDRWERNQIAFHQHHINVHLERYWPRLGLGGQGKVFVPLCGKSLDMLWLAGEGHQVLGVEISPLAVQSFFRENGLEPQVRQGLPFDEWSQGPLHILCGDFFHLRPEHLRGVGAVYDRASLIALPPEMRPDYAEHLVQILPREVRVLLVTMEYPEHEMAGPPFSVREEETRTLFSEWFSVERVAEADILPDSPGFRAKGLTSLYEKIWILSARAPHIRAGVSSNAQRSV